MSVATANGDVVNVTSTEKPRHKHRILNRVQLLAYKLFFAHLGKFIVVALYFILLETLKGQHTSLFTQSITLPDIKGTWDSLLSANVTHGGFVSIMTPTAWDSMRHVVFRGVLEGVLGFVLFAQIGFNVEKYREKKRAKLEAGKTPNRYLNKFFASPYQDCPVTPLQYLMLPVMLLLVTIFIGVPVYLGVHYGLANAAHWSWLEPHISSHASVWDKIYGGEYDGLIVGLFTGFVAGRTYKSYLYANTMNYGRSWVAKDRGPKWWMPKPTRDLIRDLCAEGVERQQSVLAERHNALKVLVPLGITFAFALAVFGYFVISTNGFTS